MNFIRSLFKFFVVTYLLGLLAIGYFFLSVYYYTTGEIVTVRMHRDEYNQYQTELTACTKARAEAEVAKRVEEAKARRAKEEAAFEAEQERQAAARAAALAAAVNRVYNEVEKEEQE